MSRSNKPKRKPQSPKPRNYAAGMAMLELRQGSRTSPVPSGKAYRRKPKSNSWE